MNAGAVKVMEACAFPAVADPIIGASGLRPSWESVIPMFSIFELYHSINRFFAGYYEIEIYMPFKIIVLSLSVLA